MTKTLIRNACIVTMEHRQNDLERGDILIEGETIVAIAPSIDAGDAEIVEGEGTIVMPGFVDAHRHLWEGGFRAVTSDWSILDFMGNIRFMAASFFRPEDMYATARLGGIEALDAGVTTLADYCHNVRSPEYATETLRGVADSGVRCVWGYGFVSLAHEGGGFSTPQERLDYLKVLARDFSSDDGLVSLAICPKEVFLWGEETETVKAQFEFAADAGLQVFMHCNTRARLQSTPREAWKLHTAGFVSDRLTLIHMGATNEDEWSMLADEGASVCYTPETEYQMNLGWPTLAAPQLAGVNLCLGTDMTANNSADMFFPTRMFLQVQRSLISKMQTDPSFSMAPISCHDALRWATINAAHALGLGHKIGSLAPGKQADIVMLRADGPSMAGWDRRKPATAILQHADTRVVDSVWVAGKAMKRNGRLLADVASACRMQEETTSHVHDLAKANGGFDASLQTIQKRMAG